MSGTPSTSPAPLTGNNAIDAITNGYYWNLDSTRTLNWALANGFSDEYWIAPYSVVNQINKALHVISYYADIKFNYVGQYQNPVAAAPYSQITFSLDGSGFFFNSSTIWARGLFPAVANDYSYYPGAAGDIYLNINSAANSLPSYEFGTAGFALILHEVGHTLGLKHPHDDGGTGHPTFRSLGINAFDQDWFSVMSYNDAYQWNKLSWEPATPMALDALGLMAIYGPNLATNAGDSVTQLSDIHGYATHWDASGTDTLSVSHAPEGWTIDLALATNNFLDIEIGIALPTSQTYPSQPTSLWWLLGTYENVIGSAYGDAVLGNALANIVFGEGGNDVLNGAGGNDSLAGGTGNDAVDGGDGTDTAGYSGGRANYTITRSANVYLINDRIGGDGRDTLNNIENIQFADSTLDVAYETAVQALYLAYFGRAADPGGLASFQSRLEQIGAPHDVAGISGAYDANEQIRTLIDSFGNSIESHRLYTGDTRAFVTAIYLNLLNRGPDESGLDFWANAIDSGVLTRAHACISLLVGALSNTSPQGLLDGILVNNKTTIASDFTFGLTTSTESLSYAGSGAAATVRAMLNSVTSSTDIDIFQNTISSTITDLVGASGLSSAGNMFESDDSATIAAELIGRHGTLPDI